MFNTGSCVGPDALERATGKPSVHWLSSVSAQASLDVCVWRGEMGGAERGGGGHSSGQDDLGEGGRIATYHFALYNTITL